MCTLLFERSYPVSDQKNPMMKRNLLILGVTLLVIVLVAVLAAVLPQQRKVSADAPVLSPDAVETEAATTAAVSPEAVVSEAPTAEATVEATAVPEATDTAEPEETVSPSASPEAETAATETPVTEADVQAMDAAQGGVPVDTATPTDMATDTDMATNTDLATGTDLATTTDLDEEEVEAYLLVAVGEIIYQPIPLTGEKDYTLTNKLTGAENRIHVTHDSIVMSESNCDGQDCLDQGEVTLSNRSERLLGNMIICLPHNITLELLTPAEAEAVIEQYSAAQ